MSVLFHDRIERCAVLKVVKVRAVLECIKFQFVADPVPDPEITELLGEIPFVYLCGRGPAAVAENELRISGTARELFQEPVHFLVELKDCLAPVLGLVGRKGKPVPGPVHVPDLEPGHLHRPDVVEIQHLRGDIEPEIGRVAFHQPDNGLKFSFLIYRKPGTVAAGIFLCRFAHRVFLDDPEFFEVGKEGAQIAPIGVVGHLSPFQLVHLVAQETVYVDRVERSDLPVGKALDLQPVPEVPHHYCVVL